MNVLELLRTRAVELSKALPDDDFLIRGLWKTDLMFRPNINERTFAFTYVLAQTLGQGCAYCGPEVVIDENLMGKDARQVVPENMGLQIAILDAVYSAFPKKPAASFKLEGTSVEKTPMRTKVVVDEVVYQVSQVKKRKGTKVKVLNVGVVGNFLKEFDAMGYEVHATDFDPVLVDKQINGITVTSGEYTLDLVSQADVVVATGMTLATDTLDDIAKVCKESGTRLVLFAETGANFGQEYCNLCADAVVSEPFPFYIFQGTSIIDIYRKQEG